MNRTLKALGALLAYPTAELRDALAEIAAALEADERLAEHSVSALHELVGELRDTDPLTMEERYVNVFDRGRLTSLNLFEHVHGDSRDRGAAMVALKQRYEATGYHMATRELPDYLPALLEFLSLRPLSEACDMLSDCAHILRDIGQALCERKSSYSAVFVALLAWIGEPGLEARRSASRLSEKSIDEEWIEAEVVFGPAAAPACSSPVPPTKPSVMQYVPRPR
jgi:nitrate reductase delta subunit